MLHGLDLFSGIGGLTIALGGLVRPIAYCENDRFAQAVLLSRQRDGRLPIAPIWDDVRSLKAYVLPASIDIIYGGFPCQDISVAGRGKGLEGERSGLFFEILRLIDECHPTFIFLENVPAIRTRGAERVVKELSSRGYDCRWECFTAQEIGAPHRRQRWFLLAANAKRLDLRDERGRSGWTYGPSEAKPGDNGEKESLADTPSIGRGTGTSENQGSGRENDVMREDWWSVEPDMARVVNGIPQRVDRVKCLGNAVVPFQAREAFKRLMGLK